MKFVTHNQSNINIGGTCLQGYINVEYKTLKKLFGKPSAFGDDFKTDAEWYIQFEDGSVATIYNWKNGKNYCGKEGIPKTKITEWNIGGNDVSVVEKLESIFKILVPSI